MVRDFLHFRYRSFVVFGDKSFVAVVGYISLSKVGTLLLDGSKVFRRETLWVSRAVEEVIDITSCEDPHYGQVSGIYWARVNILLGGGVLSAEFIIGGRAFKTLFLLYPSIKPVITWCVSCIRLSFSGGQLMLTLQ